MFTIKFQEGIEFKCSASETITTALKRQGLKAISPGCRAGGCGACRVQVLEGKVEHERLNPILISPADEKKGFILACQSTPASDLLLLEARDRL